MQTWLRVGQGRAAVVSEGVRPAEEQGPGGASARPNAQLCSLACDHPRSVHLRLALGQIYVSPLASWNLSSPTGSQ